MTYLFILNDPPYGTERSYNGLRLARVLSKYEGNEIRVFLLSDSALCAKAARRCPRATTIWSSSYKACSSTTLKWACAVCAWRLGA